MILVIDNYDSFTYNLVQYLGELGAGPVVRRNDEVGVADIREMSPEAMVISPGPGTPGDAGVSVEAVRQLGDVLPILGVCLGHQAIAVAYGGNVVRAPQLMHGKTSYVNHSGTDLFDGLDSPLEVMRYHSLTVEAASLPETLQVLGWGVDDSTEIHAMRHRDHPVWGVQFHPESVMTQGGKQILANFLRLALVAVFVAGLFVAVTSAAQTPAVPAGPSVPPEPTLDTAYVFYDRGITLPFGLGIRVPAYNRVDGLALPWGPHFVLADRNVIADATLTYRSHIGELDPAFAGVLRPGRGNVFEVFAGRGTFTNDEWIRSDLINSLAAIGVGTDARNYFRADRAVAKFSKEFGDSTLRITPSIGALHENAWSTGSPVVPGGGPWSIFGRPDALKMRRPNPAIARGHTTSGLGGLGLHYGTDSMKVSADAGVEHAFDSPPRSSDGFTQYTVGSKASFFTFGTQKFSFRGHAVISSGAPPPQRYVYLGGGGTLATLDLLALGGDRLLFVEGEYLIPLRSPLLPFVGAPIISVRYAAGSAGIGELPDLVQNIGVGVGVKLLKAEYHFDPSFRDTPYSSRSAFSLGFSLSL